MILGDWNAKVGDDSEVNWPTVVGKFGVGVCNEWGERLLQFCAINNLAIANTMYKHKLSRRVTWISPDGNTKNQIDYVIMQRANMKLMKNCLESTTQQTLRPRITFIKDSTSYKNNQKEKTRK